MIETVDEIHDTVRELVSVAAGVPLDSVILSDQGRPAPTVFYATYNPIPVRAVGHPRRERIDVPAEDTTVPNWTDFDETVVTQMDFMLSCNFFAPPRSQDAKNAVMRMPNANFRVPVTELLFSNGIRWKDTSNPRNFTGAFQADLQQRYQIDVHLTVETQITDRVLRAAGFSITITEDPEYIN